MQKIVQNRETFIYCFLEKQTGRPIYVGKTSVSINERKYSHIRQSKKNQKSPFHQWLSKNLNNFTVICLQKINFNESSKCEVRWIKRLNSRFPLYNARHHSFGNPGIGRVDWKDEYISLLGKVCDIELSKIIGCERKTVSYQRKIRKIPALGQDRGASQRKIISLKQIEIIGTMPDYKAGQIIGVSKNFVWNYRKKNNIPSYAEITGNDGKIKRGEAHRRWN